MIERMPDGHAFLHAMATVLCVAAATTVLFQRLRQPVVLGYVVAGLIVGPYVPIPLVADREIVRTLSEIGVLFLMFSLGLEFSLRRLFRVGPTSGLTAIVECSLMLWLGFLAGRAFGWSALESVFCGAIVAISSTTIIAKAFDERGTRGRLREVVVGVLIAEDLIAILLMATLTAVSTGAGLSTGAIGATVGRLALFLVGMVVVGLLVVPRAVRAIVRLERIETTVVGILGICFAFALLATAAGYPTALGAFLAGTLVSESGEGERIERWFHPLRDLFAAIFFVSVGMLIDPALVAGQWMPIAVLTAIVVTGKIASVSIGAFLTGNGVRTSIQAGMSMAQIGEFSFLLAALGLSLGATGERLYPIAVAVSVVTTLTTPWSIRASGPVASFVDRKLPRPIQTFAALYGSWVERIGATPRTAPAASEIRVTTGRLLVDAAVLAALVIGASVGGERLTESIAQRIGLTEAFARAIVLVATAGLSAPFAVGVFRLAGRLGGLLAESAFPPGEAGKVDLAAAPRRAFVVTLQLAILLLVGLPVLAVTQPFLPGVQGAVVLALLLLVLGIAFWRSATNLQGHVRAGAQIVAAALAAQADRGGRASRETEAATMRQLLPGLGEPIRVELPASSPAVGRSLAELDLRGQTGATVLAIRRGESEIVVPTAREVLRGGDVLALAGAHDAVAAARVLLGAPAEA